LRNDQNAEVGATYTPADVDVGVRRVQPERTGADDHGVHGPVAHEGGGVRVVAHPVQRQVALLRLADRHLVAADDHHAAVPEGDPVPAVGGRAVDAAGGVRNGRPARVEDRDPEHHLRALRELGRRGDGHGPFYPIELAYPSVTKASTST
jgi:hypothetical protein